MLVLREAFMGVRRFEQMQAHIGCARTVLTARLNQLTQAGVLEKSPYQEPGQRQRHEYRLTTKGRELYPVILALRQWGDRWLHEGNGAVASFHRGCGGRLSTEVRCEHGHGPVVANDAFALVNRDFTPHEP